MIHLITVSGVEDFEIVGIVEGPENSDFKAISNKFKIDNFNSSYSDNALFLQHLINVHGYKEILFQETNVSNWPWLRI